MNTQVEFDEDLGFFGVDEWVYQKIKTKRRHITIMPEIPEIKQHAIISISTKVDPMRIVSLEHKILAEKFTRLEEKYIVLQATINQIEEVCFSRDIGYMLEQDSLAKRIRDRLVEIKYELNKRVKLQESKTIRFKKLSEYLLNNQLT